MKKYMYVGNEDKCYKYKDMSLKYFSNLPEGGSVIGSVNVNELLEHELMIEKDAAIGITIGYINVGDNEYFELKDKKVVISSVPSSKKRLSKKFVAVIVLAAIAVCSGIMFYKWLNNDKPTTIPLQIIKGENWDGKLPSNGDTSSQSASAESIKIPGYSDIYVSADKPSVQLINPDGNTVYMSYTVNYQDKVLYETDGAIPAGKMVEADFYSLFNKTPGSYDVIFQISTYDMKTNAPCNGATQTVTVTVK